MPDKAQFLKERASEMRFRLMVHVRAICWLRLYGPGGIFAHTPLVPITERHRLELILAHCAFFTGTKPEREDVKRFLWRIHPHYRATVVGREKWLARGFIWRALAWESLRTAFAYERLRRNLAKCDIDATSAEIYRFIARSRQDITGSEEGGEDDKKAKRKTRRTSAVRPDRCYADNFVDYVMRNYGLTPDQALDLPIALFNQLYREQLLTSPEGELSVFAPSDALLT